jgi:predicted aminopeptidase
VAGQARLSRIAAALLLAASAPLTLGACGNLGYYAHLLGGQVQVLRAREAISDVVNDPQRDQRLRERLALVAEARVFAVDALGLPDGRSYTSYVELDRPHVLWNVFAAPEFSLQAHQWCYLFYGCFSYRGYYEQARAEQKAAALEARGLDVHVGGVSAYSTLGWFSDPVLSSMMHWDDAMLIGTVFHELAHELYYIRDDTAFNESFATFVEEEGLRQWSASRGETLPDRSQGRMRHAGFVALVRGAREDLQTLYAQTLPVEEMRARKAERIESLRMEYRRMRDEAWGGWSGYDRWFESPINNAKLLPVGLYHQWVPAFEALYAELDGNWAAFYAEVAVIGGLSTEARLERLQALMPAPSE